MAENKTIGGGLANLKTIFHDGPSGTLDGQQNTGLDFIDNTFGNGFTANIDSLQTTFLGIEGTTYINPGLLGLDDNIVNVIEDLHGVGFIPGIQAGDDTLFVGITGETYKNPGPNNGAYYVDDYEFGPTPSFINFTKNRQPKDVTEYSGVDDDGENFTNPDPDDNIQEESNQWLDIYDHKFTPNRQHLDVSEFKGVDEEGNTYKNPGEFVGLYYYDSYNDAGTGIDVIKNLHANGFTKLRQHKNPSEFKMVGPGVVPPENDNPAGGGTLFRQFGGEAFAFGGEQKNKYLDTPGNTFISSDRIDPEKVSLIQRGGVRSTTEGVKAITMEDYYKSEISNYYDFDTNRGVKDGRLDMRYDNGRFNVNSFLPLSFSRNGITHEPYVISPINEGSSGIIKQHLNDLERVGKYFLSPDGVKFIVAQNAMGLLAYSHRRSKDIGGEGGEKYGFFGSSRGLQQFQYIYNPLSAFSSNVPFVKFRFNRSLLFDDDKYTSRNNKAGVIFGFDLTPNENTKVNGIIKQPLSQDEKDANAQTTLGGSIVKNVNHSIDGTTVNTQGITGDHYTIAPIDEEDNIKNSDDWRGNTDSLTSIEDGYPFYFKDMRNNKILLFRGFVKGLTETLSPSYSSEKFIGRSEPVYTYSSTTRNINLSLDLVANNKKEFTSIYQKLDYLTGMTYPEYFNDSSTEGYTLTRPKPPLCRMRLADLYGGGSTAQGDNAELKHGLLGYIQSLNYSFNDDSPWNNEDEESRAPIYITITLGFQVIHDQTPNINTRFYGVNYDKVVT